MTTLVAISDQSNITVWDWKGWAIALTILAATWLVITRREHVRRQNRKRDGRA